MKFIFIFIFIFIFSSQCKTDSLDKKKKHYELDRENMQNNYTRRDRCQKSGKIWSSLGEKCQNIKHFGKQELIPNCPKKMAWDGFVCSAEQTRNFFSACKREIYLDFWKKMIKLHVVSGVEELSKEEVCQIILNSVKDSFELDFSEEPFVDSMVFKFSFIGFNVLRKIVVYPPVICPSGFQNVELKKSKKICSK